jgi:hypothetical protein
LRVVAVGLENEAISKTWLALLDHYACDPMGGGAGLSAYAKANLVRELKDLPTSHGALAAYQRAGFAPYALDPAAGHALFLQKSLPEN